MSIYVFTLVITCCNDRTTTIFCSSLLPFVLKGVDASFMLYFRNNSCGLEYILILPQVGPLCQIFYQPVVKSIYIQAPMNYFYSNRTNTVFEQPKQVMTLPISWYTNIPKAFEWRHIRIIIYVYWCPTLFPSQMMIVSLNTNITGATSGTGNAYPSRAHVLTPGFSGVF